MIRTLGLLAAIALTLAVGCGGGGGGTGGGGGSQTVAIFGRVVWIETGAAPAPPASVRADTASTTTDAIDGSFEVEAPTGTASLSVTYTPAGGTPIVRGFSFPPAVATSDVGDLYIGPSTTRVRGVAVSSADNAPLAGATITIGGQRATSAANGSFTVANVAYSPNALPVFLGLQGQVSAAGFFTRSFSPPSGPSGGTVDVGTVSLTPQGSSTPPPPPFNVTGRVLPVSEGAAATVQALVGSSVVRTARADGAGAYTLWLPTGTYTIRATKGAKTAERTTQVTSTDVIKTVDVTLP